MNVLFNLILLFTISCKYLFCQKTTWEYIEEANRKVNIKLEEQGGNFFFFFPFNPDLYSIVICQLKQANDKVLASILARL